MLNMATKKYIVPAHLIGNTVYTKDRVITYKQDMTQKDLAYLRDECNIIEIQMFEIPLEIDVNGIRNPKVKKEKKI